MLVSDSLCKYKLPLYKLRLNIKVDFQSINCEFIISSVRSLGSAALNMCYVASGRADAYYEFGVHCWDIAAGIVILKEAGGISLGSAGQF